MLTSTRQSSTSAQVILLSFFWYFPGPQVLVHGGDEGGLCRLLRGAAVLQPGGVVVVLDDVDLVGKQKATLSFTLYSGLSARSRPFFSVCQNTGAVRGVPLRPAPPHSPGCRFRRGTPSPRMSPAPPHSGTGGDALVHHRLALHHVGEVVRRDGDVREHVQVRQPPGPGAGLFRLGLGQGRLSQLPPRSLPARSGGCTRNPSRQTVTSMYREAYWWRRRPGR